ncbi:MAG: class C beta-lactamase-related serine hydrolase, partial [Chrysiogenales bacterium]
MKQGTNSHFYPRVACAFLSAFMAVLSAVCYPVGKKPAEAPPAEERPDPAVEEREKRIARGAEELSRWIRAATRPPLVSSAAAVVVEGDRVLFRGTAGPGADKPFMMASLTKTFVALSFLQMADRGLISLDDPIGKYLQVEFENRKLGSEPINIWHLLTHTSGLVDEPSPRYAEADYPFTVPEQKY